VTSSRRTTDVALRVDLYERADSIAFLEAPMIFLFFSEDLFAVQPWVSGFKVPAIFNGQRWTDVVTGPRKP
jgi:peptide/nickel transport system substrate-binding protein/oligopeptide transport system substrate-binding protein